MSEKPSNICLVFDKETMHKQHAKEVQNMLENTNVKISLVAIDETTSFGGSPTTTAEHATIVGEYGISPRSVAVFFKKLRDQGPRTITHAERYLGENILTGETATEKRARLKKPVPIDDIDAISNAPWTYFEPVHEGGPTYSLPDETVDKIIATSDVVILLGFNRILRGRILTEPEYGVLSFHGSDLRRYRGRPGQYWQFLNREDDIGLTLQQLTPDLDGGNIVVCDHADISDAKTWWDVKLAITESYGTHLERAIKRLQDPEFEPIELSEDEMGVLTFEDARNKWRNEIRMTARNLWGRYFG